MKHTKPDNPNWLPRSLHRDIRRIASRFARDDETQRDLRQTLFGRLLAMPTGRPRRFYLRALRREAFTYWAHCVVDAPFDHCGRPILERQTLPCGGLSDLEALDCRRAA
jgi:hypothetical protein